MMKTAYVHLNRSAALLAALMIAGGAATTAASATIVVHDPKTPSLPLGAVVPEAGWVAMAFRPPLYHQPGYAGAVYGDGSGLYWYPDGYYHPGSFYDLNLDRARRRQLRHDQLRRLRSLRRGIRSR